MKLKEGCFKFISERGEGVTMLADLYNSKLDNTAMSLSKKYGPLGCVEARPGH